MTLAGSRSLSGTFFWVIITAAVLDLTPTAVTPAELIALKAYSVSVGSQERRTNLVKTAFGREYRDMSIISCAACMLKKVDIGITASRHA